MTFAPKQYPTGIFKQTTPDESQELRATPRFNTCWKGALARSEIYERMMPDGITGTLRIDGPGPDAGFISMQSNGSIIIRTGTRNVEKGPGSGRLNIHSDGGLQKHDHLTRIEYNAGDTGEEACNIIAYGDVVEDAVGSERHIKAQKIVITAAEELFLIGKSQVFIQAGANGGGTISMNASSVEQVSNNSKEVIIGQKMTVGAGEETSVQFDPRASVNVVSPGHINHKILGDLKQWVGGVEQHYIAGKPSVPPLIKDRSDSYRVETLLGNTSIKSVAGNTSIRGLLVYLN